MYLIVIAFEQSDLTTTACCLLYTSFIMLVEICFGCDTLLIFKQVKFLVLKVETSSLLSLSLTYIAI